MPKLQIQRGRTSQPAVPNNPTDNFSAKGKNSQSILLDLKKTKSPPKKSSKVYSSEEDEEEEESLDETTEDSVESDQDDEYVEDDESEEEESHEDYEDDSDEDDLPTKKGRRKSSGRVQQKKTPPSRSATRKKHNFSDSEEETPTRRSSTRKKHNFSDSEEETPTRRSSRSTAKRAKALIAAAAADDDSSFDDDSSDHGAKKRPRSVKKKTPLKTNGDDDFDDEFQSKKPRFSSTTPKSKNQSSKIGNADSFSFDESSGSEVSPKKLLSPTLNLGKGGRSSTSMKVSTPISPILPTCTSTHDCITMEALPRVHVCYCTPDHRSYHCFAIETLYKAAMMPGLRRYKPDGQLALLQPPHFRTAIDGTLEDQIASRFGRRALIIEESKVYLKQESTRHAHHRHDDSDNDDRYMSFEERLSKYLTDQMGHQDLYICPVCYSEAHQQFLGNASDDDKNDGDNSYEALLSTVTASKVDPMSILSSLDHGEFHVAACFCFRKMMNVKNHIKQIHCIELKNIDANGLLKKFKIRDQDGLLQRHLLEYYHGRVRSTSMRTYWTEEGNDGAFILLRSLVELKEECGDEEEDFSSDFCSSFPNRAKKMWGSLSGPFEKDVGDVEDFITDEIQEETDPVHVFEKPKDLEDEIVKALRNKGKKKKSPKSFSSDEDQQSQASEEEESEESEELEIVDIGDDDEDEDFESSGEDSWYQKKRSASKRKRKSQSPLKTPPLRKLKTNKEDLDNDDDSSLLLIEPPVGLSSADSRKRRIIDDE